MKIGIFGGTFDPIHIGHLRLADWFSRNAGLDMVWLMVSPRNPLKTGGAAPVSAQQRLEMVRLAVKDYSRLRADDTEFSLPAPSYTITTLRTLAERHPNDDFTLIVGADNILAFDRWKDPEELLRRFGVLVYPRPGYDLDPHRLPPGSRLAEGCPQTDISSTEIRQLLSRGDPAASAFLPPAVAAYIAAHRLYLPAGYSFKLCY